MKKQFQVTASPHIRDKQTVHSVMLDVVIALMPALIVSLYFFGLGALTTTVIAVVSCIAFEAIWQKMTHQKIAIKDLSAVVTGLLLAFNLPPTVPVYIPIVGAFVAIILAKQFFGGIGQNFINPALAARAFLLAAYPTAMTHFVTPIDAVTTATPLALLKEQYSTGAVDMSELPSLMHVFMGQMSGCIGEVSALA